MKGVQSVLYFGFAILALAVSPSFGQQDSGPAATTPAFVTDFLGNLTETEGQLVSLEGAVPQEKFTWRPAEGVRSISEVYLHVAFGNYLMPKLMGFEPPAEANFHMDLKKWDASTTDKAEIAASMKASFDHMRSIAGRITETDLEKKINFFGTEMTTRAAMISALSHIHEHLGQSIAYARMNGIVPPWTAAEQAAEKAKEKK